MVVKYCVSLKKIKKCYQHTMYKMGIYSYCHAAKGQVGKIKQKIRNIWELLGGTEEQREIFKTGDS